jgi:hypothetical protein
MLFLTAFFFFMSGNNNVPQQIATDDEGRIVPRITELDVAREQLEEYKGWSNGTEGNWTEVSPAPKHVDMCPIMRHAGRLILVVRCTYTTPRDDRAEPI